MKRLLLFLSFAFCLAPLGAEDADWRNVRLFDWIYSAEPGYQMLKQAAEAAGEHGWVAQRMERGDKVPQASARDLALKLEDLDSLDPALKDGLRRQFADESKQLGQLDKAALEKQSEDLQAALDAASAKLDQLEASVRTNNYGKGSDPGVTLNLYSGYRLDSPAGLAQGMEHGWYEGGMRATLAGTIGKINYYINLGGEYWYNELGTNYFDSYNLPWDLGIAFEIPLETGGLDISLSEIQNLDLSPLLFSVILPLARDGFFVDVTQPYRAPKLINTMQLNYPDGPYNFRGLWIKRDGATWYWPFTTTQFVYTPADYTYYYFWDRKFTTWIARLDEDLGQHGHWLDGGTLYGAALGSGTDADQHANVFIAPTWQVWNQQYASAYNLGLELRFSSGSSLKLNGAVSSLSIQSGLASTSGNTSGDAWISSLVQPVGPINLALELGQASPGFVTAGHNVVSSQSGTTIDTYQDSNIPAVYDNAQNGLCVSCMATPNKPVYTTFMYEPDELANNSQRLVLKAEWHGSWVSLGAYDGVMQQLLATDPFVTTQPYIEGNESNGYGWYRMMGVTFGAPPAPGSPGIQNTQGGGMGQWLQGQFNHYTDGVAQVPGSGATPVHWQMMSQLDNWVTEYTLLLTQNGIGDPHVMADSVKTLNYAGANLLLDFAALSNRSQPLALNVVGELRDLEADPAVPNMNGSSSLLNQQFVVGFLNWGLTDTLTLYGTLAYETWQSNHGFYPVNMQVNEYGAGFDVNADPIVTGLAFNFRASVMNFNDSNFAARAISLKTVSLGCTLTY
jgi:hypothetical protein